MWIGWTFSVVSFFRSISPSNQRRTNTACLRFSFSSSYSTGHSLNLWWSCVYRRRLDPILSLFVSRRDASSDVLWHGSSQQLMFCAMAVYTKLHIPAFATCFIEMQQGCAVLLGLPWPALLYWFGPLFVPFGVFSLGLRMPLLIFAFTENNSSDILMWEDEKLPGYPASWYQKTYHEIKLNMPNLTMCK